MLAFHTSYNPAVTEPGRMYKVNTVLKRLRKMRGFFGGTHNSEQDLVLGFDGFGQFHNRNAKPVLKNFNNIFFGG
jgi:hypothetical protein